MPLLATGQEGLANMGSAGERDGNLSGRPAPDRIYACEPGETSCANGATHVKIGWMVHQARPPP